MGLIDNSLVSQGVLRVALPFEYEYLSIYSDSRCFAIRSHDSASLSSVEEPIYGYIDLVGQVIFNAAVFFDAGCAFWAEGFPLFGRRDGLSYGLGPVLSSAIPPK